MFVFALQLFITFLIISRGCQSKPIKFDPQWKQSKLIESDQCRLKAKSIEDEVIVEAIEEVVNRRFTLHQIFRLTSAG